MALSAVFQADFSKWDAALKNAQQNLKSFEVSGKGVQRQLEQMTKSLSGVNIKKEADLAAAGVKAIGGAAKLTEAEQRKVNATVTEAIAKYRALGQQAPAELRKLQQETAKAAKETGLLGTAAGKIGVLMAGAFSVGAAVNLAKKVLELGGSLSDLSAKTGIGVRALQEFKFAGGQVGVSLDAITSGINQMQNRIAEGDKSAVGALKRLNISLGDFKKLKPEDQFAQVAEAIAGIQDPAERVRTAMDLMGKSGAELLPVLTGGFNEAREAARRMGVVLDEETVAALDSMGDRLDALQSVYLAGFARLLVQLEPLLVTFGTGVLNAGKYLKVLQDEFQSVLLGAGSVTADLADLEVGLYKLARAVNPAAAAFGTFDDAIADAKARSAEARLFVKTMADSIVRDATRATISLAKLGEVRTVPLKLSSGGGLGEIDKELKAIQDRISGTAILKSLRDLERAWKALTPAQKAVALSIGTVVKEYQDLASKLPSLPPSLRAFAVEMNAAAETSGRMSITIGQLKPIIESLGPTLDKTGRAFEDFGADIGFEGRAPLIPFYKGLGEQISRLPDSIKPVVKETSNWRESLEDVSQAFATLSQVSGGTLSKIFAGIGKTVAATNLMVKSIDSMKKGMDGIDKAENLGDTIAGFAELTTGILGAAAAAIELGKALWDAFTKSRAEQTAERIGREFGVAVSEEFAQTIENETAKFFGNRQAAQIFNLDRIIAEGGGLSAENIQPLFARFRDLFSMIEIGAFTGAQAVEVLDKNFRQFADFVTEGGSLASKELLEIINLTERFGLKSSEVSAFIVDQTGTALGGLTTFLDNAQVKTQAAADGIAGAIFGIFEAQSANGVPAAQIIKDLDPLIKDLDAQLVKAGLSGGEAFRLIKDLAAVASHEIAGPMITGILGLDKALAGLHNSGVLNEDMFDGLTAAVSDTYAEILATGVNGEKALQLIAPTLQTAWELSEDFGYSLDDNTQKLVDEAKAAGLVGDEHRTATEKMLIAMDRIADSIDALVKGFGFTLPKAIDGTADAIDNLPNEVTIVGRYIPPDFQGGGGEYPTEVVPMAAGGIGRVTKPTLFLAGEAGPEEYAFSGANQRFGSGSGGGGGVTVYLTVQAWDGNDVIRVAKGGLLLEALADGVNARSGGAMRLVGSISDASRVARR